MNARLLNQFTALIVAGAKTGEDVLRAGGKKIDTQDVRDPIVGFIFGSSGLMANLTLEGTRLTRVNKE